MPAVETPPGVLLSVRVGIAALSFAAIPTLGSAALSSSSRIGPSGVGPIVIGTTPRQAAATGTHLTASTPTTGSSCFYLRPTTPRGLRFLVESGTLRRAEVVDSALQTTDGFRVGDPIEKVMAHYGSRARSAPGKYDYATQTVTIEPRAGADMKYRMVFAVRARVITAIYAGALPQVLYVEGCS